MHFIKTHSTQPVIEHTARAINEALGQKQRVLWLLSGGSAISIAAAVQKKLRTTDGLTVMQVDERFGPVGHENSNWQQILDAGFDTNNVACHPILTGSNDINETAKAYEQALDAALQQANFVIGLFGFGADGHTAGIFPDSPAIASDRLVYAFQGHDFPRITVTAPAIRQVDLAIVHAAGPEKAGVLANLQKDLPPEQQPAQLIKQVREVYIYNDQMGEIL